MRQLLLLNRTRCASFGPRMPESESDRSHCGHRQRLRRRLQKTKLEGWAGYEIVDCCDSAFSDVNQPATRRIQRCGNVMGILGAPIEDPRSLD